MDSAVRFRIINVTDVYTLANFPALKTLVDEKRRENTDGPTICVLTGDFLAPYLLSSLDKGKGMVKMLNAVPVDYVIWGNHDINDLSPPMVMARAREYKGKIINSNMQAHETYGAEGINNCPFEVLTHTNGAHTRKLGFIGVLSDVVRLYGHCISIPDDVVIEDPWEVMQKYDKVLREEQGCDTVVPLCHLYEFQDDKTCDLMDVPVVLSGHDHHVVDRERNGTRLLKAGADGKRAAVVDIIFDSAESDKPRVEAEIVRVSDWAKNAEVEATRVKATVVLKAMEQTQLCHIPARFLPLVSTHRDARCSAGDFLCTTIKQALNDKRSGEQRVEAVVVCGGSIRGAGKVEKGEYFSMKELKSQFKPQTTIGCALFPGWLLRDAVKATRGRPSPNMFQMDEQVVERDGEIVEIDGKPLVPDKMYRVATCEDTFSGGVPPFVKYFKEHPECHYPGDDGQGSIYALLVDKFAANIWVQMFSGMDADGDHVISPEELMALDLDGDKRLSADELMVMLENQGFAVDRDNKEFVQEVLEAAGDVDKDGFLTLHEINAQARLRAAKKQKQ